MKIKILTCSIFLLLCLFSKAQEEQEFTLVQIVNVATNKFDFKVESESTSFKMIVCKNNDECSAEFSYLKSINPDDFVDSVIIQINSELSESYDKPSFIDGKANDEKVKAILEEIKKLDEQKLRSELSKAQNVLRDVDTASDKYSGKLILLDSTTNYVVIQPSDSKKESHFKDRYSKEVSEIKNDKGKVIKTTERLVLKDGKPNMCEDGYIKFLDATVIFFNNKASTIAVNALLVCGDDKEYPLHFYNGNYSMPLRSFTYYSNPNNLIYNGAKYALRAEINHETIEAHVNDVFNFETFGDNGVGFFGFSVANQNYYLSNETKKLNSVKVIQRRFFDFFTGIIHSDVLGFNTNSSNSIINAQASILKPMNLGNWGKISALRQFRFNANLALNNSFENDNRFIGFKDSESVQHFDLFRKHNLSTILSLDLLSYESKGWFVTWSFGYNIGYYRTGYQYTDTMADEEDDIVTGQLVSITHGPFLSFEFRPQDNFGADIIFSLDEINLNDDDIVNDMSIMDDLIVNDNSNSFLVKHNMVNVSANFYWLTSPGKSDGGIYTKVGLAYHTPTETSFPQLMVGYATNLSTFVNRFKPNKPIEKQESVASE